MGVSVNAALIVGLKREDVVATGVEDFNDWAEGHGFDLTSPYYDGGGADDAIAGLRVAYSGPYRVGEAIGVPGLVSAIEVAIKAFQDRTGLTPQLLLTPDVT